MSVFDVGLRRSLVLVTTGGCLFMVFLTATGSSVMTEYLRQRGISEFQFGLLAAVPQLVIFMQFVAAWADAFLPRRKAAFIVCAALHRMLYFPVALVPLAFPHMPASSLAMVLLVLTGVSAALGHFTAPLWYSWMADLIPKAVFPRYWAVRQQWNMVVWTASMLAVALLLHSSDMPLPALYGLVLSTGALAGTVDILLFVLVREPEKERTPAAPLRELLGEPLRDPGYRRLLLYGCGFSFAATVGASFMILYMLKVLGLGVWETALIQALGGAGHAVASRGWGRLAAERGNRPLLVLVTCLKSGIVLAFVLVGPSWAAPFLGLAFFLDGMLNAGHGIAFNGCMLGLAPERNRPAFMAAILAFTGVFTGLGALLGGVVLEASAGFSPAFLGRTWNNYQLLFALSLLLRLACVVPVLAVREENSAPTRVLLRDLLDVPPLNLLFRPARRGEDDEAR